MSKSCGYEHALNSHNQPWTTNREPRHAVSVLVTLVVTHDFLFNKIWPNAHSVPRGSSPLTESSNVQGLDVAGMNGSQRSALEHELAPHYKKTFRKRLSHSRSMTPCQNVRLGFLTSQKHLRHATVPPGLPTRSPHSDCRPKYHPQAVCHCTGGVSSLPLATRCQTHHTILYTRVGRAQAAPAFTSSLSSCPAVVAITEWMSLSPTSPRYLMQHTNCIS